MSSSGGGSNERLKRNVCVCCTHARLNIPHHRSSPPPQSLILFSYIDEGKRGERFYWSVIFLSNISSQMNFSFFFFFLKKMGEKKSQIFFIIIKFILFYFIYFFFFKLNWNQDASEYQCESGEAPRYVPHKPITGVIGASFSTESIMVANILRLFKVKCEMYFFSCDDELVLRETSVDTHTQKHGTMVEFHFSSFFKFSLFYFWFFFFFKSQFFCIQVCVRVGESSYLFHLSPLRHFDAKIRHRAGSPSSSSSF